MHNSGMHGCTNGARTRLLCGVCWCLSLFFRLFRHDRKGNGAFVRARSSLDARVLVWSSPVGAHGVPNLSVSRTHHCVRRKRSTGKRIEREKGRQESRKLLYRRGKMHRNRFGVCVCVGRVTSYLARKRVLVHQARQAIATRVGKDEHGNRFRPVCVRQAVKILVKLAEPNEGEGGVNAVCASRQQYSPIFLHFSCAFTVNSADNSGSGFHIGKTEPCTHRYEWENQDSWM